LEKLLGLIKDDLGSVDELVSWNVIYSPRLINQDFLFWLFFFQLANVDHLYLYLIDRFIVGAAIIEEVGSTLALIDFAVCDLTCLCFDIISFLQAQTFISFLM
jgi:hypothetical protein